LVRHSDFVIHSDFGFRHSDLIMNACPACECPRSDRFYEVDHIPTQSNLLMATAKTPRIMPAAI